jgi:hypothetical protein
VRQQQPITREGMDLRSQQLPRVESVSIEKERGERNASGANALTPRLIAALCCAGILLMAIIGMAFRGSKNPETAAPVSATPAAQQAPTATGSTVATENQAARMTAIMKGVRKHMLLPNEVPQVMQITNPEELMKQDQFFLGAQKDDVLLIYQQVGKALIYSEARDIIVNVGPVQLEKEKAVVPPVPAKVTPAKAESAKKK